MRKIIAAAFAAIILTTTAQAVEVLPAEAITVAAPSAVLMERSTGQLIYEKNSREHLPPASVTKVMSLLLVMEELEAGRLSLDDIVSCSSRAASMGGSQIWLEEGEQMSVHEMLKCVAVSSANDCTVALAEHISGSEEAFVAKMNERAAQLGLADTNFTHSTGLFDDDDHYTCAWDIAVMSRELMGHDLIREYTTIWMDTVRGGEFGLSNTNKLIFYYDGATGLKTGFTQLAGHCLSATAMRGDVEYIAVVLHCASSDDRFESAKTLLSYAFANYALVSLRAQEALPPVTVELGVSDSVQPVYSGQDAVLLEKASAGGLEYALELPESLTAPIQAGEQVGTLTVTGASGVIAEVALTADQTVERMSKWQVFTELLNSLVSGKFG